MDVLIDFCRTGALGPLRRGMTAEEVERLLGRPDKDRWIHGDSNWQSYRYGSLSLVLRAAAAGEVPTKQELRLKSIQVNLYNRPLTLPPPIVLDAVPTDLAELLAALEKAGVDARVAIDTTEYGFRHQRIRTPSASVTAVNGRVDRVSADG